jgi:hypothetical protein
MTDQHLPSVHPGQKERKSGFPRGNLGMEPEKRGLRKYERE